MNIMLNHSYLQNFSLFRPRLIRQRPFIITSAHSGIKRTDYLQKKIALDKENYLCMEDSFINDFCYRFSDLGCTVLQSNVSRIVIDLNRNELELSPNQVSNLPNNMELDITDKVKSGIGLIPIKNASGTNIYEDKLTWSEIKYRIENYYRPWHTILDIEKERLLKKFGKVFIIDLHSMPSIYGNNQDVSDFIIGNNHDKSSSKFLRNILSKIICDYGYKCSFNYPYSGGYITQKNGSLNQNIQCIQLEINKNLYMNEKKIIKKKEFNLFFQELKELLSKFFDELDMEKKELFAAE